MKQQAIVSNIRPDGAVTSDISSGRSSKRRQLGKLIGAIDQGTSSTRFLVFENQTGNLIASSQIEIKRITPKEGWVEIDAKSIMSSVYATIDNVYEQLNAGRQPTGSGRTGAPISSAGGQQEQHSSERVDDKTSSSPQEAAEATTSLLKCIGICNQRESTVVWDKQTGQPLYNVIVWMDNRTKDLVDNMIDSVPGRDLNRLKDKTGLPMSTYFSAFKLRWLIENVDEVRRALREKRLLFGTVDSWILWNLTGGKHLTDVTNASRTFLMDIETLEWDKSLCKQLNIPMEILPKILASADDFGCLQFGPFKGTPITGVIGDQSAALFGHNCLQLGQTKATFGTGCFIMQNIGPGPLNGAMSGVHREAKRGLITTVGYKLGNRPTCYALEGSIKIAGAALTWLRDNLQLIENYEECDQLVNKTTHSAGVFFVPALGGLYSPYWDPNAAGLYIGLSQFTRREHLIRATFDSIAFQTNDILSLMHGVTNGLMIDGGLCKSDNLCQILADITGYEIVRPSMCETSALGAAMVAGYGAGIWNMESMLANSTPYEYSSSLNQNHHYPHASLHYEEKFSSLIQSKSLNSAPSVRAIEPSSATRQRRLSRVETANSNSIDHRIHCNLDAGGGVNDDAGGGGRLTIVDTQSEGYEDDLEDASSSQLVSSDTDFDVAGAAISSGEFSSSSNPADVVVSLNSGQTSDQELPTVIASGPFESSGLEIGAGGRQTDTDRQMRFYIAPSSGYSSSDNFESATTNSAASCQLTDPIMPRSYSPVSSSQITDALTSNGRDSATTCTDLTQLNHQHLQLINPTPKDQSSSAKNSTFPFDLTNSATDNSDSAVGYLNLDQFRVKDSCTEEVHAFRGRDSYGEDGYDSSTASNFDSDNGEDEDYDDVDEQPLIMIEQDDLSENREKQKTAVAISRRALRRTSATNSMKPVDVFQSYISLEHRTDLVTTWRMAVERSMQWTKVHHEEIRRIDYQRLSSLPISMYLFFSIGIVALSSLFSPMAAHN